MRDFRACHPQHTTGYSFPFRSESALQCRQLLLIRSVGSSSAWQTPFLAHLLTSSFTSFISVQTSRCIRLYVRFWPIAEGRLGSVYPALACRVGVLNCTIVARKGFHRHHRPFREPCIVPGETALQRTMPFSNTISFPGCTETLDVASAHL